MSPRDYFSAQAADYAMYRPHYPATLFAQLAALSPDTALAWDCATGSGQAAVPLACYFDRVIATDMSATQLDHATPHARVEYRVATADESGLPTGSASLVNVAQALHWLNLDGFYAEVTRVLAKDGVLSVSSYGSAQLDTPALADVFSNFELVTLGPYWAPERNGVGEGIRDVPFPFTEIAFPKIPLAARWTLDQLLGYAGSWSATATYMQRHGGADPVIELDTALRPHWGSPEKTRTVRWPFVVRAGRV